MNFAHLSTEPPAARRRILLGVVPATFVPCLGALLYYVVLVDSGLAPAIYAATKVFTIVWPLVAVLVIERQRIHLRRPDWAAHVRALPLGVLSGLCIGGLTLAAYAWTPLGAYVHEFSGAVRSKVESLGVLDHYLLFGAFLAGIHSLIEEYYWRWYVFGRLAKVMPLGAAHVLAGLAFAAHHYVLLGCYFSLPGTVFFGTCVGIGGILWSWLYRRQHTLVGAWVSHALIDVAIVYVGYRLLFA